MLCSLFFKKKKEKKNFQNLCSHLQTKTARGKGKGLCHKGRKTVRKLLPLKKFKYIRTKKEYPEYHCKSWVLWTFLLWETNKLR